MLKSRSINIKPIYWVEKNQTDYLVKKIISKTIINKKILNNFQPSNQTLMRNFQEVNNFW
jgi:hypothetical protein